MKRPSPRWLMEGCALVAALPALPLLVACSRSAPREARSEPQASAPAPPVSESLLEEESAASSEARSHDSGAPGSEEADASMADVEKKAEPSLSSPPSQAPAEEWSKEEPSLAHLEEEERSFAHALDPSALSCSGALPLRDAICTLAERICALPSSGGKPGSGKPGSLEAKSPAERDCERARASCEQAKKSYAGRCGG